MNPRLPLPVILPDGSKLPRAREQRLHGAKRMTLVARFEGVNGAILAADSEETVGGYAKRSVQKLEVWSQPTFTYARAAATDSGSYADMLTWELDDMIRKFEVYDPEAKFNAVKELLVAFYSKHMWPRPANEAPQIQLLILFQPRPKTKGGFAGRPLLLHTSETSVNVVRNGYKSIGVGSYLADFILDRMLDFGAEKNHMLAVAAYVFKQVSENIVGVGKEPAIHYFGIDGGREYLYGDFLAHLESLTTEADDVLKRVFHHVTNVSSGEPNEPVLDRDSVIEEIAALRYAYEATFEHEKQQVKLDRESLKNGTGEDLI